MWQLASPGAPVLYGGIPGMADMRDLSYRAGGVEFGLMNAAISQLAAYLGIPNYCSAGITEAKIQIRDRFEILCGEPPAV